MSTADRQKYVQEGFSLSGHQSCLGVTLLGHEKWQASFDRTSPFYWKDSAGGFANCLMTAHNRQEGIAVNQKLFKRLMESMGEMNEIARGTRPPSREYHPDRYRFRAILERRAGT